jgi:hypothetical protein
MKIQALMAALLVTVAVIRVAAAQPPGGPAGPAPTVADGKIADQDLDCNDNDVGEALHESRALRTAPEGAKRISAHVLAVNYRSGVRRFIDPRPYREELDGIHWQYCAYIPAHGAHLIGMMDGSLFSGKLLLDRGGALLDAGNAVYPSPDGKLFLAARQVDGEYLARWMISDLAGRKLWDGESGLTRNEGVIQEYEDPRWITNDTLRVVAICNNSARTRGEATLVHEGESWRWRSDLRCGA